MQIVMNLPRKRVTYNLPHVFYPGSSPTANAQALEKLLETLTEANVEYLRRNPTVRLYNSGVYYDRTTEWDSIPALYTRRYGDCKSLTCALVAEYRLQGLRAKAVF